MGFSSFVEGPLLWVVFVIFIGGIIVRVSFFVSAIITSSKERNSRWRYSVVTFARSFIPFYGAVTKRPLSTAVGYIFHLCLMVVPIWLAGHIALWEESRFSWSWAALPDRGADLMTIVVVGLAAYYLIRRISSRDIRLSSSPSDYLLLMVTALPFVTGYLLTHDNLEPFAFLGNNMRTIHVLSAEAMLLVAVVLFYRTDLNRETCTGCASCKLSCPTGTLESADEGILRIFTYSPYECICCGECVGICPEEAAGLRHELSLNGLFHLIPRREIRSVELKACERCGQLFAPEAQVDKIGQTISDAYLRFCPTCKGRVMLREL